MSFHFHPEAEAELNLSIDDDESIDPRLGYDFALEVYETIQRIVDSRRRGQASTVMCAGR